MNGRSRRREGFTLVELLVVIAIIGILVSMLLPAVNAARDVARRLQCGSNMRQVGTALQTHHEQFGNFPPGLPVCTNNAVTSFFDGSPPSSSDGQCQGPTWIISIFPFMEEGEKYDRIEECFTFDANAFVSEQCISYKASADLVERRGIGFETPAALKCGAAPTVDEYPLVLNGASPQVGFDKGSMAGCFGAGVWINPTSLGFDPSSVSGEIEESEQTGPPNKGVFEIRNTDEWNYQQNKLLPVTGAARLGRKKGIREQDIKDGTTKTIAVSEVVPRKGVGGTTDGRGAWMYPGMGGSSFTGLIPPNAKGDPESNDDVNFDHILKCGADLETDSNYGTAQSEYECVTITGGESSSYAGARSRHVGGVNVVFAGGNTQFIGDSINVRIWRALCTRSGPDYWTNANPPLPIWAEPPVQLDAL